MFDKDHEKQGNYLTIIQMLDQRWAKYGPRDKKVCPPQCYRAFHQFGQAKFPDNGSILGSSQFSILPLQPLKNDAQFKSDQN